MSSDIWHSLVSKLRRIEDDWKPRQPQPGIVTATHGSSMGFGVLTTANSFHLPSGVLTALPGYETYSRVSNVIQAIEDAEPVAFNTITKRLSGITLDDIKPILVNILKDIALYVGGSTVIGAGVGGAVGSLAFGAGAIPGAAAGAAVGAEVGNLILMFTGLKSIAIYMKDAVPKACRYYVAGFNEAWGPRDFGRPPFITAATDDFARGHVLFLTALLMGIVVYLTRGKGNMQSLFAEVRSSARLGPRMATWLERNEDKLLNDPELRQGMRSDGVGGASDRETPKSDIPKPTRAGSSGDVADKVAKAGSDTHKAARWQEYQDRGGEWDYDRWSKVYEANMTRATEANKAVDAYHETLGWGEREVTVPTEVDGVEYPRRLDIADTTLQKGIEYKTGEQYATEDNLWEVARDKSLVEDGWDIQWVFRDTASQPLKDALDNAGIQYTIGP